MGPFRRMKLEDGTHQAARTARIQPTGRHRLVCSISAALSTAGAAGFWVISFTQCRLPEVLSGQGIVSTPVSSTCPVGSGPILLLLLMASVGTAVLTAVATMNRPVGAWTVVALAASAAAAVELPISRIYCSWAFPSNSLSPVLVSSALLLAGSSIGLAALARYYASWQTNGAPIRLATGSVFVFATGQQALWFAGPIVTNGLTSTQSPLSGNCTASVTGSILLPVFALFAIAAILGIVGSLRPRLVSLGFASGAAAAAGFVGVYLTSGPSPMVNSFALEFGVLGIALVLYGGVSVISRRADTAIRALPGVQQ